MARSGCRARRRAHRAPARRRAAGARHLRRHAGAVRPRRRARNRDRGPRRVAGHWSTSSTRPCCRTWAGTRVEAPEDSVLFDGIARRALLLRALLRRARAGTLDPIGALARPRVTWAEHGEPLRRRGRERAAVAPRSSTPRSPGEPGIRLLAQLARESARPMTDASSEHLARLDPAARRGCRRRQGGAPDPGRGRQRDQLRRPGRRGRGVGRAGRRVDPPGRPRRGIRPRRQPRA